MSIFRLRKEYKSLHHDSLTIEHVNEEIFKLTYFTHCLKHKTCFDQCCSYGVDVDKKNWDRFMNLAESLENYTKVSKDLWFTEEWTLDEEVPGGSFEELNMGASLKIKRVEDVSSIHFV